MELFTIGVYNSSENEFFDKLKINQIDTFCDIRQRRGVRGSKYSFVNYNRLQHKLNELEIKYGYIHELAPTTEIRDIQKNVDMARRELKNKRQFLDKVFITEYTSKILNNFNFESFIEQLEQVNASRIVFFCVEEFPEACHRSLVTDKIYNKFKFMTTHL